MSKLNWIQWALSSCLKLKLKLALATVYSNCTEDHGKKTNLKSIKLIQKQLYSLLKNSNILDSLEEYKRYEIQKYEIFNVQHPI